MEEMKSKQEEAVREREQMLARKDVEARQKEKQERAAKEAKKEKQKQQIKALSFNPDEEEDEEGSDNEDSDDGPKVEEDKKPDPPRRRLGKDPQVDTSFLPDIDRDEEENQLRETLRRVLSFLTVNQTKSWAQSTLGVAREADQAEGGVHSYHVFLLGWIWSSAKFDNEEGSYHLPVSSQSLGGVEDRFQWAKDCHCWPTHVCQRRPDHSADKYLLWLHCNEGTKCGWMSDGLGKMSHHFRLGAKVDLYLALMFMTTFVWCQMPVWRRMNHMLVSRSLKELLVHRLQHFLHFRQSRAEVVVRKEQAHFSSFKVGALWPYQDLWQIHCGWQEVKMLGKLL